MKKEITRLINIFLHILGNLVIFIICLFFGTIFCLFFYPIYFEKYYCYLTYLIVIFLIIFLIKKKKYLLTIYSINILLCTSIFSYGAYRSFFLTKQEQKKISEDIKKKCENEPEYTENIVCISYRLNIKNKK